MTARQRLNRSRQTRIAIAVLRVHGVALKNVGSLLGLTERGAEHHWGRVKRAMGGTIYDVARMVASVEQSAWGL